MSEPAETRRLRKLADTEQLPDDFSVERSRVPEDEARANPGMAIRKARVLSKMFGTAAKPVSIGRFVLLELLGAGAMGEVYAGYDGELDRKVAIKLVRVGLGTGHQANERLFREAQILAQLSHPNVVQVYEAGRAEGRVFIAMEYIRGTTLTRWLERQEELPRRARQRAVLQQFLAAGRGLQAAHELDLAHRDFKPDNALVSDDGRLRVVDFGLAHVVGTEGESVGEPKEEMNVEAEAKDADLADIQAPDAGLADTQAPAPAIDDSSDAVQTTKRKAAISLTSTGTIMGTPRFMAPEQMHGQLADARSDQFSFCVALFHALYGAFPFVGSTLAEIMAAVDDERIEIPRGREVSGAVRKVLLRGLAADPDRRFASMAELLTVLESHVQRRRRTGLVAMAAIALAATTYGLTRGDTVVRSAPTCDGGPTVLARTWNDERRAALSSVFAGLDMPYASEAGPLVVRGLDDYGDRWLTMHRQTCEAHRDGLQSDELFDIRNVCLERRRAALGSALGVLEATDGSTVGKATEVVQRLPRLEACADVAALTAAVKPPEDPVTRDAVEGLRKRLSEVDSLHHGGRTKEAEALAVALVAEAEALDYQPVLAEALLVEGRARMSRATMSPALPPLERASLVGLGAGATEVGLEALARRLFVASRVTDAPENLLPLADIAESLAADGWQRTFAHGLLLNNVGTIHLTLNDRARARDFFERAIAAKAGTELEGDLELLYAHTNLALVLDDPERSRALQRATADALEATLGPSHTRSLKTRLVQATWIDSPSRGAEVLAPVCERFRSYHPDDSQYHAWCDFLLANMLADSGRRDAAASLLAATARGELDRGNLDSLLVLGYGLLYAGEYQAAQAELEAALDSLANASVPPQWRAQVRGKARVALGFIEYEEGRYRAAVGTLESVVGNLEQLLESRSLPDWHRRLAWARLLLARSLWADATKSGGAADPTRACALIERVRAWYAQAGDGYAWRSAQLARWQHRCGPTVEPEGQSN